MLLVDDDGLVRKALAEQLQELGLDGATACDGSAALRALATETGITLLVSDLMMPGMIAALLAHRLDADEPTQTKADCVGALA